MRVSIIIPCYNHAHFLRDAVQSALSQTWPDCEVIVVDDGSTDESGAVARSYPRVRLVSQENRGLAAARNAGFAVSRGDLLIFLDADDRLWPDAARTAVDVLSAHPHAAMAYGRCRVVNGAGVPGATNPDVMQAVGYEQLLRDNCIWTPAMAAFRRRVLDTVGVFDETNSPAADYDLYLRTSRQFPIVCHERTVVDYRQHANNMSRDPVLMLHATLIVLRAQAAYAAGDECRRAAYRDAVASWRACYGERLVERFRTALRDRRFGAALRDAAHLLRLYPAGVRHHIAKKVALLRGRSANGVTDVARP